MESKISDNQLMNDFSKCSVDAFNQIFHRYKKKLFNFIMRTYLRDRDAAEDIVSVTLTKVWMYKYKYKPSNQFSTWIYTISRNLALNEMKRNKAKSSDELKDDYTLIPNPSSNPAEEIENRDISEIILEALHSLGPKYSEVLSFRYLQELSFKEISVILRMNIDTVKSIARRGLDKLRGKF